MTDLELLEKAARAAGIDLVPYTWGKGAPWGAHEGFTVAGEGPEEWNPLEDDGEALRLAVKLRLLVNVSPCHTEVCWYDEARSETHTIEQWDNGMTPDEWTRRAIVRAAAAMAEP